MQSSGFFQDGGGDPDFQRRGGEGEVGREIVTYETGV